MPTQGTRARGALLTAIVMTAMIVSGASAAAATEPSPEAPTAREQKIERVIRIAKRQIGDPWVWGMRGPRAFDCTGLVYFSFRKAHALPLIGGRWRGVRALWDWARRRDIAGRHDPRRGDLVVWGDAAHVGIYLGHGRAISALVSGVQIHRIDRLYDPFSAYLHIGRS